MGDTLRRVLCGSPRLSSARKSAVRSTVVTRPEEPLPTPPSAGAAHPKPGLGAVSTRDHCACGRFYETSDGAVWQELRGGHLRCFCGGCAP